MNSDMDDQLGDFSKFTNVNTKKLVCIQYPGYIKNIQNMLATIGGEKKLSETYFNNVRRLQMTYRPDDLNAHKACADLIPYTGLLIKVKRRRRKNVSTDHSDAFEIKQEIIGIVKDEYRFQTLMDYQYLTPEPLWDCFKELHSSELGRKDFPPYFAPPTFGRIDSCGSYNYRPNPLPSRQNGTLICKDIQEKLENNSTETTIAARKRRQTESMAALFDSASIPKGPSENAVKIINNFTAGPELTAIETIRKLFEERPIWSKLAISCHLNVSLERLKKILQYFAYYWLSGPWRTMWCRMDYDPRNDPKAKIYQMIDFRIRDSKESKRNYAMLVPKRSFKNYIPRNLQSRVLPVGSSVLAASEEKCEKEKEDLEPYIFSADKILPSRNMLYQLCDIHEDGVQNFIHENDNKETTCDEKEGWFPQGTMNKIRQHMAKTVHSFFEREKLKRKGLLNEDSEELNNSVTGENYGDEKDKQQNTQSNLSDDHSDFLTLPSNFAVASSFHDEGGNSLAENQPYSYLQMLQDDDGDDEFNVDDPNEADDDELYYNMS